MATPSPDKPVTPTDITYQEFKAMIPNAHKFSRKELRKAHREYLEYAKERMESEEEE